MSQSTSCLAFRWLDLLEKEFDKSYVGIDRLLYSLDGLDEETQYQAQRRLLSNMAQCFVQLAHKAQTIFQANAKLEAELLHHREERAKAEATFDKSGAEKQYLICCLQSVLVENHRLKELRNGLPPEEEERNLMAAVQLRLANELATVKKVGLDSRTLESKCRFLEEEKQKSQRTITELESEIVGARLDAKYLDKELAGRIQQIQILLATNTTQEHKQKVWSQIEAEMHLQRSKTISNMCYSKQKVKDLSRLPRQGEDDSLNSVTSPKVCDLNSLSTLNLANSAEGVNGERVPKVKQVHLHKHEAEELGMAILGGKEHGLPIMISEIFPDSSVSKSGKVSAGDVILSVNGDTFEDMTHNDAVKYLSALRGTITFDLENNVEDDILHVCDMEARYYDLYGADRLVGAGGKRSPAEKLVFNGRTGSAASQHSNGKGGLTSATKSSGSGKGALVGTDLPEVHANPKRPEN